MIHLNVRLDDDQYDSLKSYAKARTDGNLSAAIRDVIALGLDADARMKTAELSVSALLDDFIERFARVQSRGTRAALANLYLASAYLPSIADAVEASARCMSNLSRHAGSPSCDEAIDAALHPVAHLQGASAKDVFDAALRAGGNLQRQQGAMDYFSAHRAAGKEGSCGR